MNKFKFDASQSPDRGAFQFYSTKPTKVGDKTDSKTRKFSGVGYSGGVIPGHWYWGNVIFALDSIKQIGNIPALIDHDRSLRAGYVESHNITDANGIEFSGVLLSNDAGSTVSKDSDEGFPWQMSVHIEPGSIEEVKQGSTVFVNGVTHQGPITVFRNSTIVEVSFTATGQDSNTSAKAFSKPVSQPTKKENEMTPEQIKALQDELAAAQAEAAKFSKDNVELHAKVAKIEADAAAEDKTRRTTELKTLFSSVKRELDDTKLNAYLGMNKATFSVVFEELKTALKPTLPGNSRLFSHGGQPEGASGDTGLVPANTGLVERAAARFAKVIK